MQDLGAVMTAGLAARELEKRRGRHVSPADGDAHPHGPNACANCGTALIGDFCHACGQNGHVHKTFGAILHDIGHGVFHFEGKVWHTLPMLAWKPGQLTRRYIDGERVRFVSPMALFLFSVFVMFASIGLVTHDMEMPQGMSRGVAGIHTDLAKERADTEAKIARLEQRRAKAVAEKDTADIADYTARIAGARSDLKAMTDADKAIGGTVGKKTEEDKLDVNTGLPALDNIIRHATDNPQLALYKVKTAAYKYSWALIPISLPFIWLLFPFSRRFGFYDHAIFATYSLSFMTFLVTAASVLTWAGVSTNDLGLLWLVPPFHMYRQLKGAYLLDRFGALWRTVILLFFTIFTTTMFGVLLAYLGLA